MPAEFVLEAETLDCGALDALCGSLERLPTPNSRLFVHARDQAAWIAALHLGERHGLQVIAIPASWPRDRAMLTAQRLGGGHWLGSDPQRARLFLDACAGAAGDLGPVEPGIVIFTTGTTGVPKAVSHSWDTISASAAFVSERLGGLAWYLPYEPAGYAGLQVYFSARNSGGRVVLPSVGSGFTSHPRRIVERGVEVISATPTWWRMLVSAWPSGLPFPRLKQATLGGEIVDQATLDLVSKSFRPQGMTHIYASSEVGTAIVVSDRQEGFPVDCLDESRRTRLRIQGGELHVKSPLGMRGYMNAEGSPGKDGWFCTGDLVEIRGRRCYFVGRLDQRLNIGGAKVSPEEVEAVILELEGVAECFVYGKPSPILGTLLAADVVPAAGGIDVGTLRRELGARLPAYKVPQYFRMVDAIEISDNGKKQRA